MAGVVGSFSFSCDGEGLAGVAAVQHVDSGRVCSELSHVGIDRNSGPMPLEDGSAVLVVLAEPRWGDADSEVESADATEERARIHSALFIAA